MNDGVREEELFSFSCKIVCSTLRLNWVETVVHTISPSAWWLHTTNVGLPEEAGGLQGSQVLDKILKKKK